MHLIKHNYWNHGQTLLILIICIDTNDLTLCIHIRKFNFNYMYRHNVKSFNIFSSYLNIFIVVNRYTSNYFSHVNV